MLFRGPHSLISDLPCPHPLIAALAGRPIGQLTAVCTTIEAPRQAHDEFSKEAMRKKNAERIAAGISLTGTAALKRLRPTTPGSRGTVLIDRSHLWKGRPIHKLTVGLRSSGGRGTKGRIAVRHRGGGHKRRYRFVDFKRKVVDEIGRFPYPRTNAVCDVQQIRRRYRRCS